MDQIFSDSIYIFKICFRPKLLFYANKTATVIHHDLGGKNFNQNFENQLARAMNNNLTFEFLRLFSARVQKF